MEGTVGQDAGRAERSSYFKEYWCIPMKQEPFLRYAVDKDKRFPLSISVCEAVTSMDRRQSPSHFSHIFYMKILHHSTGLKEKNM